MLIHSFITSNQAYLLYLLITEITIQTRYCGIVSDYTKKNKSCASPKITDTRQHDIPLSVSVYKYSISYTNYKPIDYIDANIRNLRINYRPNVLDVAVCGIQSYLFDTFDYMPIIDHIFAFQLATKLEQKCCKYCIMQSCRRKVHFRMRALLLTNKRIGRCEYSLSHLLPGTNQTTAIYSTLHCTVSTNKHKTFIVFYSILRFRRMTVSSSPSSKCIVIPRTISQYFCLRNALP